VLPDRRLVVVERGNIYVTSPVGNVHRILDD